MNSETPINIGVLEDDADMRAYLAMLIRQDAELGEGFSCGSLQEAREAAVDHIPDICLVDIRLPDGTGLDFIRELKADARFDDCKFLILTVLGDRASVLLAFEIGANGYLLKDTPAEQIKRDIKAVIAGGNPISPQAASHVLSMMGKPPADAAEEIENTLTTRERDVLQMFAKGMSYKETARALDLSVHTVSDYVKSIYHKMQVHSRNEAVFEAVQNGWLEI